MSAAQSFLFFLIVLGAAATGLRLISRTTPIVPYPVLLAIGGILIGLIPGLRLPGVGPDLILLAFVPGLIFEASRRSSTARACSTTEPAWPFSRRCSARSSPATHR